MSDIDFYDAIRKAIQSSPYYDYDLTSGYFKKNPYIAWFQTTFADQIDWYMVLLQKVIIYFDETPYMKGTLATMLDSIRTSLLGRPNYPH